MVIEIWSDVMCPFCYIGKRRLENAMAKFSKRDEVEITWKSFQLNPDLETDPSKNVHQFLAERKRISLEKAKEMNAYVTEMAASAGLKYNFDNAIVANSFDAHRLSHLAKKHGLQNEMEERLFAAYFTEGKNTADHHTLISLGSEIGLDAIEIKKVLDSDELSEEVRTDIYEAHQIGVTGVPFFVFNNKYAISGAQETDLFLEVLNKAAAESA
jgi:predicted DsbA family dithiol-disulfide isomerase